METIQAQLLSSGDQPAIQPQISGKWNPAPFLSPSTRSTSLYLLAHLSTATPTPAHSLTCMTLHMHTGETRGQRPHMWPDHTPAIRLKWHKPWSHVIGQFGLPIKSKCGRKESDCSVVVLVPVNNFLFCGHFRDHGSPRWWILVTTAHSQHVWAGLSAAPTSVTVPMSRHFLSSASDPDACWEQPQNQW